MNSKQNSKLWYKKWWGIIIAIVFLPYFLLWYIWSESKMNNPLKRASSVGAAFLVLIWIGIVAHPKTNTANTTKSSSSSSSHSQISKAVATSKTSNSTKSKPATPAAPSETHAQIVSDYESSATTATVSQLVNSPSTYNGETVTFSANIVNFLQDDSGNTTAMNVSDPNDPSSLLYVQLSKTADVTQMSKGDTITVWGDGLGDVQGKNSFGGTINESSVSEVYLNDTTNNYQDISDNNPL